jgi:protein SHQ1
MRRAVCFPLYRSYALAKRALINCTHILTKGRTSVLRALLAVHRRLNVSGGEYRYVFNDLYVTDYLLWVQSIE